MRIRIPASIGGLFLSLLLWVACPSQVLGRDGVVIGVNQVNLAWLPAPQRQDAIASMADAGVGAVRLTLNPPFPASLDAVEQAVRRGLQVVLAVSLNVDAYYSPGISPRAGGRVESAYPLSAIRPERFQQVFQDLWSELERRQIRLLAMEVGNEINWAFNGDVAAQAGRPGQVHTDLSRMPGGGAYQRGLDRYMDLLRIVHEQRSRSAVNRDMLILAAGMARIRPDFAAAMKADVVDAGTTLSLLAEKGLSRYADAAAIHYYPAPGATPVERREALDAALKECGLGRTARSCWMTEWGISNAARACPLNDDARADLVRETRRNLAEHARRGSLEAAFYFEWDGRTARSIWRCGGLTEAGRLAIAPLGARP
ncbi:hypothetical protein [Pseudoroseomonas sp. WGS1072]|uniref:hypothetical protein n=1 Tax=Roseomonas sp. WGS1072 TaxID=3366816 RepID=UPI003BF16BD7